MFLSVHLVFHAGSALVGSCVRDIRTLQAREAAVCVCVCVYERERRGTLFVTSERQKHEKLVCVCVCVREKDVGYCVRDIRTLEAREVVVC